MASKICTFNEVRGKISSVAILLYWTVAGVKLAGKGSSTRKNITAKRHYWAELKRKQREKIYASEELHEELKEKEKSRKFIKKHGICKKTVQNISSKVNNTLPKSPVKKKLRNPQ